MKIYLQIYSLALCFLGGLQYLSAAPSGSSQTVGVPAPTPYEITTRNANSRVGERTVYETSPTGDVVGKKHYYTTLASGMHYKDANGRWVESKDEIEAYPKGAIARQGQYQVIFANNLNTAGSIDMQTPDGKRIRSNVLGLSYYDRSSGQSVLIAQIQDSQGELISSNQTLYPNAFEGVRADVRYTYKKGSFEQDVILREQPPTPESVGLNSQSTIIEVITEFIDPPKETIRTFSDKKGLLPDQDISWGAMRVGRGKAFDLDESTDQRNPVRVMKEYMEVDGRKILLEKVPFPNIDALVSKLPRHASLTPKPLRTASKSPQLPNVPLAQVQQIPMKLATRTPSNKGFVLDYVELNTDQYNFTFQADQTYIVENSFNLYGDVTFEGGTVIKSDPGGQINIGSSSIYYPNSNYRPVIFTSINDNLFGEPAYWASDPYYTGSPSYTNVTTFLNFNYTYPSLRNMRFCYATLAVAANDGADVWDTQFVNVQNCVVADYADINLYNVLIKEVGGDYPIYINGGGNFSAQNVTCDGYDSGNGLVYVDDPVYQSVFITNSLVTSGQYISINGGAFALSAAPIYQTVGGGSYYLTNDSPYRNVGTSNLTYELWADLRQKTTYAPPVLYINTTISNVTTISPQVQRDTDAIDLGYHYAPLDCVISGCNLTTNLTVTPGTAIGFYGDYGNAGYAHGLALKNGASMNVIGTASAPCWLGDYKSMKEGGNGNWTLTLSGYGNIVFQGTGTSPYPRLNTTFTKWVAISGNDAHFQDLHAYGLGTFNNCEFYGAGIDTYRPSLYFTNCLFDRVYTAYWDQSDAANFTYQNCTFYNGFVAMCRYVGQSASFWTVQNTFFDGTGFLYDDNFHANSGHTYFDYNGYNTNNNTSYETFNSGYWSVGTMETNGPHDVLITLSFGWASSWLGDFYQPYNSQLYDAGSTTADQVGLFHYTARWDQGVETNSIVDIGYHYVAVDYSSGNFLDSDGDGIPDYLEDANGNGRVDTGETDWQNAFDLGFKVLITRPRQNSIVP